MAADPAKADSVYDFLYVDLERIGLLISQFGPDGVLTDLIREAESGAGSTQGLDKVIVSTTQEDERKKLTRRFDHRWVVPLRFLDLIHGRLKKFISTAALGDFVQIEGRLWLFDTALLHQLYTKEATRNLAINKMMQNATAAGVDFNFDEADFELDLVASTRSQIQAHLYSGGQTVWSTLRPSGLITPPEELLMKHGVVVDGAWHVVGIKDANPMKDANEALAHAQEVEQVHAGRIHLTDVVSISERLRAMFGRPWSAYGITPLMIFRPTGGQGHTRI